MDVVPVRTFSNYPEAALCAERLEREQIPTLLLPLGGGMATFGTAMPIAHQIRVRAGDVARARALLRDWGYEDGGSDG